MSVTVPCSTMRPRCILAHLSRSATPVVDYRLAPEQRFPSGLEDCVNAFRWAALHAGVRNNLSIWPELPHVWHAFLGLFPEATEALRETADFVRA